MTCLYLLAITMVLHTVIDNMYNRKKTKVKKPKHSAEVRPAFEEDKKVKKGIKNREMANRCNTIAKYVMAIVIAVFNIFFWTVALLEYFTPPEEYLTKNIE